MGTPLDRTVIETSWPPQANLLLVESERQAKGILILFEKCLKCEVQGFPL